VVDRFRKAKNICYLMAVSSVHLKSPKCNALKKQKYQLLFYEREVLYHFDQFGCHMPCIRVVWTKLVSGHRSQPILAGVKMWFANWVKKVLNLSKRHH